MSAALVKIALPSGIELEGEAEWRPDAPAAVVCHPHPAFGGRMDTPLVLDLADALAQAGWATLRFNFRGLDGSGGKPTGGLQEHEDVAAAVGWARAAGASRIVVVGYSFGALMAARAVSLGLDVAALAAVGLPTTIVGHDADRVAQLEQAFDRRLPWLLLQGDRDQFCELERIEAWAAPRPWLEVRTLPGRGHFFAGPDAEEVCRHIVGFVGPAQARVRP